MLWLPPHNTQHATFMRPFQCDLQPQLQETHRGIELHTGTTIVAKHIEGTKRPQPQPPHTRGTCHRRLQPLYTEKHKVLCSGFLSKTKPMQHSCSHSNAICNHSFKKRIELHTGTTIVAKHIEGTKRPQLQPPHTRGTFHRRLQPLYTEKRKVLCFGFLPNSPLAFVTASLPHHFPSSPLPFIITPLLHRFPSSPLPIVTASLPHHFPSSPLPFIITSLLHHSLPHHLPSSPLPFLTTSLPHHSPSSSLPFFTTSHRHHFPSSPLPIVTTSHRHHFPSSPRPCITTPSLSAPLTKVNSTASYSFVLY